MNGVEVINLSMSGIEFEQIVSKVDSLYNGHIDRIQIDNNYSVDPLFPVMLKPMCTYDEDNYSNADKHHCHKTMDNVQPILELFVHQKTNVPNVTFVVMYEFMFREL